MITKKDINKLEGLLYLYALSKTSSKREVAEKLGTSVDTINKYISDLEIDLSTHCLISNGRGTVITPEGERILESSACIIKTLRSLGVYGETAAACKGTVRLGMTDAMADYLGADELFDFMQNYPEIHLENTIGNTPPNMSTLEADICITYDEPVQDDLVIAFSGSIKCALFGTQKYIDTYGAPKDFEDLLKNHRIVVKESTRFYALTARKIIEKAKHIVYRTNSINAVRTIIGGGIGVGLCPIGYGNEKLIKIDLPNFNPEFKIYVVVHKDTKDIPRIRIVLDLVKGLLNRRV